MAAFRRRRVVEGAGNLRLRSGTLSQDGDPLLGPLLCDPDDRRVTITRAWANHWHGSVRRDCQQRR